MRMRRTLVANLQWLRRELRASRKAGSRWRIVTGHYVYGATVDKFKELMREGGAQLYIGGHTHSQSYFPATDPIAGGINTLLSGAGGGIQIEYPSDSDLRYGFSPIRISFESLYVRVISDNGTVEYDAYIHHNASTTEKPTSSPPPPPPPPSPLAAPAAVRFGHKRVKVGFGHQPHRKWNSVCHKTVAPYCVGEKIRATTSCSVLGARALCYKEPNCTGVLISSKACHLLRCTEGRVHRFGVCLHTLHSDALAAKVGRAVNRFVHSTVRE